MKSGVIFCAFVFSSGVSYGKCVSPRVSVSLPDGLASEFSLHPNGDFALLKDQAGAVTILDLRDPAKPQLNKTKLPWETIPVTATWSHFAYSHEDGTELVAFDSETGMLKEEHIKYPAKIQMLTSLPGKSEKGIKFRALSSDGKLRDDTFSKDKLVPVDIHAICSNLASAIYPMALSPDGSQLLASTLRTTHVFRIRTDATCEGINDFSYLIGKGAFNFSSSKNHSLAFEAPKTVVVNGTPRLTTAILVFNQESKKTQKVSLDEEMATAPNFLRDGRVAYMDYSQKKIILVDPSQLDAEGKAQSSSRVCIQEK
jgi:WD40 repeat protein